MIRSTKTTLKFANQTKKDTLNLILVEYKRVVKEYINLLWNMEKVPTFLPLNILKQVNSWFTTRLLQCAGKQASGIVRGTLQKQKQRLYIYEKLLKENQIKKAKKLKKIIDNVQTTKPDLKTLEAELSSCIVKINFNDNTTFDGWITLTSIGNKIKLILPFNQHKHFNKMLKKGKIKSGIRLSDKQITFMFDIPDKEKNKGKTIGIDIGSINTISTSNNHQTQEDQHGWSLNKIQKKLSRKKKGSKGFERTQKHRTNYINWSINQLNLSNVSKIKLERIKDIRRYKKSSRFLSHWTYTEIFGKLERYCEEQGVLVEQINPTYTSQRCAVCGWVRENNRHGKLFKCGKCGHTADSDLNAAMNISLDLPSIKKEERLRKINRAGFYWLTKEQAFIVPVAQKNRNLDYI